MKHIFTAFCVCFSFLTYSQTFVVGNNKYVFDQPVLTIIKDNSGNTYVGGGFRTVGLWSGNFVKLDKTTGQNDTNFVKVGGRVSAVVPIPSGGWYIGGQFQTVNGILRNRLARINADGTLHAFDPNIGGSINALALDGSGNLYAGGFFTTVGSTTRKYLCKFDNTGALTSFDPNINNIINALALDGSGNLYAGGQFSTVGGSTTRNKLCKFDNTGALTSFDPNMQSSVESLALDGSGNLYVGGSFISVGVTTRNRLCKFDNTGTLTSFNPDMGGIVRALALDGSGNLYAGGSFTWVGRNFSQKYLCKFDNTGTLTSFDPKITDDVNALVFDSIGNLYVGGSFKTVGGSTRNRLCKFDNTGTLTSFNPNMNSAVNALALDGLGNLYAGGNFVFVGGYNTRNFLCKFDNTGTLTSFDPNMNSGVNALALDGLGNLYAGGLFTTVGGSRTRKYLCKFDNTGTLTSFDPNMSSYVNALALDGLGNLYAGGEFTTVGGSTTRNRLCKFDNIGTLTSFDPNMNSAVNALALDGLGNLYVGGDFETVGGSTTRNRLCKFDNLGILTSFDPNMSSSVSVFALDGLGNLYAGGSFTTVGGSTTRNRLCKFDNTGTLTSFNPDMGGIVRALALDGSGNLYAGGAFTTVGSTTRNNLCKFDNLGTLTSFDPFMSFIVRALALDGLGNLYVGGGFTSPTAYFSNFTVSNVLSPPTITPPGSLVVCSPSTLTLTASGCAGTVTWSEGAATGTSLTLSAVGTYSITATCTVAGVTSAASAAVTGLEIKAKPNTPTVNAPTEKVVCFPSTLTLTASGCAGTVTWSQGAATGSSLTLSTVGTYSISATCTVNGCTSDASTAVTGLEIKAKPSAPSVTAPTEKVVCFPSTLTLTASPCAGTVTWSEGAATGSSLTLSTVGTYSKTATCTVNGCTSDPSTAVTGLEIKAKPSAPTVNAPTEKVVCFPSTLTLTASGCEGTVTWSNAATGTSLTLSTVGTYSITATCTVNGCTSDANTAVTGLEIKAQPIISSSNTGPYTVGQTINLNGTGIGTYIWTGPNNFTSTLSNPTINNALSVNAGVYTLSVTGLNSCINTSTTNVVVNQIDPCDPTRIVEFIYVKAGNPYQPLFQLSDGMVINQITDQVSILANPVCSSVTIESMEMNIQGPELNWNTLQNAEPNALFDNAGLNFNGRNFNPGNYTLTVTGYARDNKGGGLTYGPNIIRFTVVGNLATINAPTLSKTSICAGSSVDVTFATSGTFNDSNQYLIELSDTSGSFAKPLLIGTTNATGTITCLIPQNTVGGSKYLIRVKSSNQVVLSNPVISQVTVKPLNYSLVSPTNNLTGASTKKAVDSINASNKIISPANVVYQAGKSVLLTPGFESGAVFRAEVKSCDN